MNQDDTAVSFRYGELAAMLTAMGFEVNEDDLTSHADRPFEDLGLDSLAQIELVATLEDHWGVQIAEQEAATLTTPAAVLARAGNLAEMQV
ncbi:MAG: phosphopantetheine-binding protein [Actinomycetota bacterium]|nr:phosphopantetheine-binding protein [Actinomycetota bacterium]